MGERAIDHAALEADWEAVGAPGAVRDVARAFLDDADVEIPECIHAALDNNFPEVIRLAHRLKSASASLHADRLARILREVEDAAKNGDGGNCVHLAGGLEREYPLVRAELLQVAGG